MSGSSPPRTIRMRSLHGSIRNVSGASVAQALAVFSGSAFDSDTIDTNLSSTLREKLMIEYGVCTAQLALRLSRIDHNGSDFAQSVVDAVSEAVVKVYKSTVASCGRVKSIKGKDLDSFYAYCSLFGLGQLCECLKQSLDLDEDFHIPEFQTLYLRVIPGRSVVHLDLESLTELSKKVTMLLLLSLPNRSDSPKRKNTLIAKSPQPKLGVAKKSPTRSLPPPSPQQVKRPQPPTPIPPSPPPRTPGTVSPDVAETRKSLLKEAIEALKAAATPKKSPPRPNEHKSPTRDERLVAFAQLISFIHEPYDPDTDEAIKSAIQLKAILRADLDSIEKRMQMGEMFSQE